MHRRDFVSAIALLGCFDVVADENQQFDGVWQVNIPFKGTDHQPKYLMMKQVGNELRVRDLQTGTNYTGVVNPSGIKFNMSLGGTAPTYPSSFEGAIKQGTLAGHTEVAGEKYQWMASKLTSAYSCSNHRPNHVAKSREDMEKFTKESKCEGWQRARPDVLGLK